MSLFLCGKSAFPQSTTLHFPNPLCFRQNTCTGLKNSDSYAFLPALMALSHASFLSIAWKYHASPPAPGPLHVLLSLLEMLFLARSLSQPAFPWSILPHLSDFPLCSHVISFVGGNLAITVPHQLDSISGLATLAASSTLTAEQWSQLYIYCYIFT